MPDGPALKESSMRVLTIEGFGGERGDEGYVYEGEAYLFRFTISSPENFFRLQLPYVVKTLKIDPRQIYKLSLYGRPGVGLYDVRLYVSFLKKPTPSQVDALKKSPPPDIEERYRGSDHLLIEFENRLKELSPSMKRQSTEVFAPGGS
jgi:hypothetical protein